MLQTEKIKKIGKTGFYDYKTSKSDKIKYYVIMDKWGVMEKEFIKEETYFELLKSFKVNLSHSRYSGTTIKDDNGVAIGHERNLFYFIK